MAVGEDDVNFGQEEDFVGDEQPASLKEASSSKMPDMLPPDDGRQRREAPEAGEEIQAASVPCIDQHQ